MTRVSPLLQLLATRYLAKRSAATRARGHEWAVAEHERAEAAEALAMELDAPGAPPSFTCDGHRFYLSGDDRQLVVAPTGRFLRVGDYRGLSALHVAGFGGLD